MSDQFTEKDERKLLKLFKKNETQAEKIVNEPSKLKDILKGAISKANDFKGPLEKVWDNL